MRPLRPKAHDFVFRVLTGFISYSEITAARGTAQLVLLWLSPLSLMEGLLFRATGHSDFALLGDGRLFEAALVPTVCLQLCLMGILLFLAVKVISPRRRKRKFTTEQNLIK